MLNIIIKMEKQKEITKEMTINELIEENPEMLEKLGNIGLGCGGCPMSQIETIEDGALAHGIEPEALLKELKSKDIE